MTKALIVGIDSTIGAALHKELLDAGWEVFGTSRRTSAIDKHIFYLDLSKDEEFHFEGSVDVVFLCASITKIASCEDSPESCRKINLDAQIKLAEYFLKKNSQIIFLSTNAVFDGKKPKYQIYDATCPVTTYGELKAIAEKMLLEMSSENVSIVRLTKVLTPDYPLFLQWKNALKSGQIIEPFHDLYISPLSIRTVTAYLKEIAEKKILGIIHLSGECDVSYQTVAEQLVKSFGLNCPSLIKPKSFFDIYPNVRRPLYASLSMVESNRLFDTPPGSMSLLLKNLFSGKIDI